jgi:4-phytase/acid phosphatase
VAPERLSSRLEQIAARCAIVPAKLAPAMLALAVVALAAALFAATAGAAPRGAAATPGGKLMKFVILSRHGVRAPIPSQDTLDSWTASRWPRWYCGAGPDFMKACAPGELTPKGRVLARQMGDYYRAYLASFLPADKCPGATELYLWADVAERTKDTGLALLSGFRPSCDSAPYFHTASGERDPIFHPVTKDGACRLDAARAERAIVARTDGGLDKVVARLRGAFDTAQATLQCCRAGLCQEVWSATCPHTPPAPNACTLTDRLPTCLVSEPTEITLGGALAVGSTFAEILLLEYANGFPLDEVGWGRITRPQMTPVFRLHTTAFDLTERTEYLAKLQGSLLLKKILLALKDENDGKPGTAPVGAKFVAYVGHDTNIANLGGMLGLAWSQPGYQTNQTPPAGALIFELRDEGPGRQNVYVSYVAQSLDRMRAGSAEHATRTPIAVPGCSANAVTGFACPLATFESLVTKALDPDCAQ